MKNLFKTKLLALLLSVAGLFCVSGMYAWHIDAGYVYFDNTVTKWNNVYIRFGTNEWCTVYKMEKMGGNDNIYQMEFQGRVENIAAVQFAAVSGYDVTDPSQCYENCGIYNGNAIPDGQKTAYINESFENANRLVVATGNTNYCSVSGAQPMPSKVTYTSASLDGNNVTGGGTVGYFTPGKEVAFEGTTTIDVSNNVHATFKYYLSGSTYSDISCAGEGKSTVKSFAQNVTLPSAVGKYTMSTYYKCGGPESEKRTSYYHIVGLTGHNINFGSVSGSLVETENLTGVWNGLESDVTVSATISDGTYFKFVNAAGEKSTTIPISDKSGSVEIEFTAPESDYEEKSDILTLTLTYDTDKQLVKTYVLSGKARAEGVKIIQGSKTTVSAGPKATLHGYMQYTGCNKITERGFYYSTTPNITTSATKVTSSDESEMVSGDTWECVIPTDGNLSTNTTYYFRPYVLGPDGIPVLSESDYTFKTTDACNYDFNDTVYVQVDKSFTEDDQCALKFKELQGAYDFIKGSSVLYNSSTKVLNYNIVILVAPAGENYIGTGTTSITGGEAKDMPTIIFEDINNTETPQKSLIIKSSSPVRKPSIQHPTIRNSKNITFENVRIVGSSATGANGGYDNALDIDCGSDSWLNLKVGAVANANINFKGCYIYSNGFTCVHVSAYDGVAFENCDIEASLPESSLADANTIKWGSSAKFIKCKNINFLRNTFRGSHATSVWIQGVIGFLAMNNVFWNDNDSYVDSYKNNGAFFRLVTQKAGSDEYADLNQKIGIYYNTLYIANNESVTTSRNFDFLRLGSGYVAEIKGNLGQNQCSSIRFLYNNCYSYDTTGVDGANQSGDYKWCLTANESDWCSSIQFNNYWSMKDGRTEYFVTPDKNVCSSKFYNVNVYEQSCSSVANDPSTLVIKGSGLNLGSHIDSDVSGLGGENYYNDRLNASNGADAVRRTNGSWTIGAYQQVGGAEDKPIETIVWWGDTDDNWDNRNNWRKLDGTRVTCVDNLSTNLKVIIPSPESSVYPTPEGGVSQYPFLPVKFSGERTSVSSEAVNAGQGVSTPTQFASTIEVEYGGVIKGITALRDDEARRYAEAVNHFEAERSKYLVIGTVVRPFADESKDSVRNIISGDYFLHQLPVVYMRRATLEGEKANWDVPFTSLDESVDYDKCFAVKIPNQYGYYKLPSEIYFKYEWPDPSMLHDGIVPKMFTFSGWFLNDEVYPEYPTNGGNIFVTNTYPANILVKQGEEDNNGTIKYYNYEHQDFETTEDPTVEVKSQNAFIFIPGVNNNGMFRITKDMLTNSVTKYKSVDVQKPYIYVMASNPNGGDGSSSAGIVYDELKPDRFNGEIDLLNTVISTTTAKPEIYVEMYGRELDKVYLPDFTKSIPLGLQLQQPMTVEFSYREIGDMEKAELEDRETGEKYDLLSVKPQIALAKGTYSGRFFLNLTESEEPIPTDVEDENATAASIGIYGDGKNIVISSSDEVILKKAEITDISGRTTYIDLKNPHYNKVNINGAQGVYVVKAIGDVLTETRKVMVK